MKNLIVLQVLFLLIAFTSCTSSGDDGGMNPPPNNVTYANTVKSIIDNNCISCHSNPPVNGAPMSLTTFNNVKNAILNAGLIERVEDGSMPPSGTDLTTAQVQAIKDWQLGGFKE